MINDVDECLGFAVSEGAVRKRLDLIVHPFQSAVRGPGPCPRHNPIPVTPQHPSEIPEWLDAAVGRPPEPLIQIP